MFFFLTEQRKKILHQLILAATPSLTRPREQRNIPNLIPHPSDKQNHLYRTVMMIRRGLVLLTGRRSKQGHQLSRGGKQAGESGWNHLRKEALLQLQHTVCVGVLGQVQLVLPLQTGRHEPSSQEVIPSLELQGGLLGCSQRDEHVGLQTVGAALLHIPAFKEPEPDL